VHRRKWGIWYFIIILGTVLPGGAGCACHRTGQGWLVRSSRWSLEINRTQCPDGAQVCNKEQSESTAKEPPVCKSGGDEESIVLNEANPQQLEKLNNSPFAKLLEHRGRLGICASCGRLGRFNGSPSEAEQKPPQPVIARFVPVPTEPVFCPRQETLQPVSYEQVSKTTEQTSLVSAKKTQPIAIMPEEPPLPPISFNVAKSSAVILKQKSAPVAKSSAVVPKQISAPQEQTSWIFSPPPEKKPDQLIEAQLPPRPSERATR
jgi:hypothetical protein